VGSSQKDNTTNQKVEFGGLMLGVAVINQKA
jgi:hypothetical protein